jgi:hypothetical protein
MQKMLVLKAFREEKVRLFCYRYNCCACSPNPACIFSLQVLFAVKEFVKNHLGVNFIQSPPTTMADIHGDSDPSTPIIFILSVGTNSGHIIDLIR